jgi:hypothetical protein
VTDDPGSRYTAKINLAEPSDTHALAIGRTPAGSRVLDLGVADGSVAAVLKDMGCRVSISTLGPGNGRRGSARTS